MNKHLYRRLLQRGSIKAIKELEARDRIIERNQPCFSTQEQETATPQVDRNKGCYPVSTEVRGNNPFDASGIRSGNRGFRQLNGKIYRTGAFNVRVMKV